MTKTERDLILHWLAVHARNNGPGTTIGKAIGINTKLTGYQVGRLFGSNTNNPAYRRRTNY